MAGLLQTVTHMSLYSFQHSRPLTAPPPSHLSSPPMSTHSPTAPVSQLEPTRVPVNGTPVTGPHTTQSKKTKVHAWWGVTGACACELVDLMYCMHAHVVDMTRGVHVYVVHVRLSAG